MKIKMTLVVTSHDKTPLRTPEVIGSPCPWPPSLGSRFRLVSESLDNIPGHVRMIITSPVRAIIKVNGEKTSEGERGSRLWRIRTENSTYELETLEDHSGTEGNDEASNR